jgi:hypothetical protein
VIIKGIIISGCIEIKCNRCGTVRLIVSQLNNNISQEPENERHYLKKAV